LSARTRRLLTLRSRTRWWPSASSWLS